MNEFLAACELEYADGSFGAAADAISLRYGHRPEYPSDQSGFLFGLA